MEKEAQLTIDAILEDAFIKFGKSPTITSRLRTPQQQAKAMYPHFESRSTTLKSYAAHKAPLFKEIADAYNEGKKANVGKAKTLESMTTTIQAQKDRNQHISHHMSDSARDISVKELSEEDISKLKAILRSYKQVYVLDETKTNSPHIHVHMK